jgi:hypothetical protein
VLDFDNTLAIIRIRVNAGRADLIENALSIGRRPVTSAMIGATIESERTSRPAAAKPATRPSIVGGPTAAERDQLAVALENRSKTVYPRG